MYIFVFLIYLNWNFQIYYEDKRIVFLVVKFMIFGAFAPCVDNFKVHVIANLCTTFLTIYISQYCPHSIFSAICGFRVIFRINIL
jgi:hypothetical protein